MTKQYMLKRLTYAATHAELKRILVNTPSTTWHERRLSIDGDNIRVGVATFVDPDEVAYFHVDEPGLNTHAMKAEAFQRQYGEVVAFTLNGVEYGPVPKPAAEYISKHMAPRDADIKLNLLNKRSSSTDGEYVSPHTAEKLTTAPLPHGPSGETLADFDEGQWWFKHLQKLVQDSSNADDTRAVFVVLNLLNTAKVTVKAFNELAEARALGQAVAKHRVPEGAQEACSAAVKTLDSLGYTYHGGEMWKPPLGPATPFQKVRQDQVIDALASIIDQCVMRLTALETARPDIPAETLFNLGNQVELLKAGIAALTEQVELLKK